MFGKKLSNLLFILNLERKKADLFRQSQDAKILKTKFHISKALYQWICFSLKKYFTNPEIDLINFEFLTKFYLRGCQTYVPIVRRNVPKKSGFLNCRFFVNHLGHWANNFRFFDRKVSADFSTLHFRCPEAHFEEKQSGEPKMEGFSQRDAGSFLCRTKN